MANNLASADHLRTIYPSLDYEAFPTTADEWFAAVCVTDTGHVDCVPAFLRPYIDGHYTITDAGFLARPVSPFNTPLRAALYGLVFDPHADYPWKGMAVSPTDAKVAWDEHKAEQVREAEGIADTTSDLYFIASDDGPIKIGVAMRPEKRLKQLQTSNPHKLRILAVVPGGAHQEPAYHERFAAHRLEGEWFARAPDILAAIERLSPSPKDHPHAR